MIILSTLKRRVLRWTKKRPPRVSEWPHVDESLLNCEDENAVAALRVDLGVAAGGNSNVLLPVHHVRNPGRVDARAAVVLPQFLAGARVISLVPAVCLTIEHEVARCRKHASDQRLWRFRAPRYLARIEIDRN